jgi:O-methyltransferase
VRKAEIDYRLSATERAAKLRRPGLTMQRSWRHRLANAVFPRHIGLLDKLNSNARLSRWIKNQSHLPILSDRLSLYRYIESDVLGRGQIDYLEFGVYEGESIRQWTELNRDSGSRFFGFDSFTGLPTDWGRCRADRFDVKGRVPVIEDTRVSFIAGWFQDTLPPFLESFVPRGRIVINSDSDLYSSTLFCLTKLDPLLIANSVLIFDEFYSSLHEFRAVDDYCESYRRSMKPIALVNDVHGRVAFVVL